MNTILLVDDEPAIRELLDFGLRLGGFRVQHAANGKEALALYRQDPTNIQLVILDMQMPGLDGVATFQALRQVDPAARCCFVSGGMCSSTKAALLGAGALYVFEKPIRSVFGFVKQVQDLVGNPDADKPSMVRLAILR